MQAGTQSKTSTPAKRRSVRELGALFTKPKRSASKAPDGALPVVRKMGFEFGAVPRHWFYGEALPTHVANGLNLLFPLGERFFIRSVKHYLDRIDDPELVARVRAFFGQEGRHGFEHEAAFRILEAQGFEIQEFLAWYEDVAYGKLEPNVPPSLRLAVTVALEHFTASLAERALTAPLLDGADETMAALLKWHACEEIEHKSVAFDVFEAVDGRYAVRIAGLLVATATLLGFWTLGTRMLMRQERISKAEVAEQRKKALARGQDWEVIKSAFLAYLRPGFHPDDVENYGVARDYLERIGRLEA
jgi:predicted metal-dependent hydrolase